MCCGRKPKKKKIRKKGLKSGLYRAKNIKEKNQVEKNDNDPKA
jgi:hypothetical protein